MLHSGSGHHGRMAGTATRAMLRHKSHAHAESLLPFGDGKKSCETLRGMIRVDTLNIEAPRLALQPGVRKVD